MKILLTADPEIPVPPQGYGGIERIVDSLARVLREWGHTVGLIAHPDLLSGGRPIWMAVPKLGRPGPYSAQRVRLASGGPLF